MHRFLEELLFASVGWVPTVVGMGLRLLLWRPFFGSCGRVRFGTGLAVLGCRNIGLGDGVRLARGVQLYAGDGRLEVGSGTSISPGVTVDASSGEIRIGQKVAIGPGTVLRAANHRFDRTDVPIIEQGHTPGTIVVEDDVWIAANCTITPDVRLGHGSIIGAGAVVTHDVEPFCIVGGVPARVIGRRVPEK